MLSKRELLRSICRRKLPEHLLADFDSSDFDALAECCGDSDSSDLETFTFNRLLMCREKALMLISSREEGVLCEEFEGSS